MKSNMSIYDFIHEYLSYHNELIAMRKVMRDLSVKKKDHEALILAYLAEHNLPGAKVDGHTIQVQSRKYRNGTEKAIIKVIQRKE